MKNKEISVDEFFVIDEEIAETSEAKLKEWHKKSAKIKKEHKFLGRSNFKFWFDQYFKEFRALFFMVLLIYLYKKYRLPGYVLWASLLGISTSIFIHYFLIFKTAKDFYDSTYLWSEALFSLLGGAVIIYFVRWLVWKQSIKLTVYQLFNLVNEEDEKGGFIKEEKKDKWSRKRVKILHDSVGIKDDFSNEEEK